MLDVTTRHDVYDTIEPRPLYEAQSYAGKVVLITGASRGIGQEIALQYGLCGASLALMARNEDSLQDVKHNILAKAPDVKIELFPVDVTDIVGVKAAVQNAVDVFGHINMVIANAGRSESWRTPIVEQDPEDWWKTAEVNLKGVYLVARFTLPFLSLTKGYCLAVSSPSAYWRMPCGSAYTSSKLADNCFCEFLALENPEIKVFSVCPGGVLTSMTEDKPAEIMEHVVDTPQLPACTMLQLTSGRYDWLSGRVVSVNWDLSEVEKLKEKILSEDALVSQLRAV